MKFILGISLIFLVTLFACSINKKSASKKTPIEMAIAAHGGGKYDQSAYAFKFRGRQYTFKNNGGSFEYTVKSQRDGKTYFDVLNNDSFTRSIDNEIQTLSEKDQGRFGNSLNSVIYFALLPYKLNDPAVKKQDKGTTIIKGKEYYTIHISFAEEGGGTDHDDNFYYWVNKETKLVDYLAYNYQVNKGGVRFREAYNSRKVEGIVFQDYVNYKAEVGTPLAELPKLFENGKLKELSKIELEQVGAIR
jgi:hypothetical protein